MVQEKFRRLLDKVPVLYQMMPHFPDNSEADGKVGRTAEQESEADY